MGFRFRKSIRIAPGVRINLSKSGVSTSIGGKGLTLNSRGRVTASVPGTGLSYTSTIDRGAGRRSGSSQASSNTSAKVGCGCLLLLLVPVVFVAPWILLILIPVGILYLVGNQLADQASKAAPTTAITPQGSRSSRSSASAPSQAIDLPFEQSGSAALRIPPLPPPPPPELDSLATFGSEYADFQDFTDQDYQIIYVDRNGNRTERRITINRIENGYVYAFCHLRNDERTFFWSRMEHCVNCASGEVLRIAGEGVSRDGVPADDESNEYQNSDLDAAIGVLLFLGKGDRRLMQHERDILIRVYGLLYKEGGLSPDQISGRIDCMNTPSRTRYKVLVSQVKSADLEVRRIVLDSAEGLFSKRKTLNPVEVEAMETLKSKVMRD